MPNIILFSDSSCDLTAALVEQYNINLIPFYISFDQNTYYKENVDITLPEFYSKIRTGEFFPKTSLPSINDYYEHFLPVIQRGDSIICLCLSSKFSGSYVAAVNARNMILDEFQDAQITVIDSMTATGAQGMLVLEVAKMIQAGLEFYEIVHITDIIKTQTRIFFYVDTLDYLEKGGRIGKVASLLGSMFNVKPIIYLADGELFPYARARGKKKATSKIIDALREYISGKEDKFNYAIAHSDAVSYIKYVEDIVTNELKLPIDAELTIGITIGTYTGPDACGVCCVPKYEQYL
ncbi:MAG: EDD domain protein [Epulopiscium sp. Nuni2H_MBin003]|nr:MAG: EDD domain protein [Epulopiscium sp. Nuni2H_MBin003]